jgi:hypothetical protein
VQGQEEVLLSPGMALATVAIGHGLPVWPKERPRCGMKNQSPQLGAERPPSVQKRRPLPEWAA